jgi:hypothetical protein
MRLLRVPRLTTTGCGDCDVKLRHNTRIYKPGLPNHALLIWLIMICLMMGPSHHRRYQALCWSFRIAPDRLGASRVLTSKLCISP